MDEHKPKVMLPQLTSEELQVNFNKYALLMGSLIANAVGKFMDTTKELPEEERPHAPAVGAACYVAAHMIADVFIAKGDDRGVQILEGLAATAMMNIPELLTLISSERDDPPEDETPQPNKKLH